MEFVLIATLFPFALSMCMQFDRRLKRIETALKLEPEAPALPSRQSALMILALLLLAFALGYLWVLWH